MILLQETTIQITKSETVFDIILKGGWILVPIVLLSLTALYFIVESYLLFHSYRSIDKKLIDSICEKIKNKDYNKAKELAKNYTHPIGRIIEVGLDNSNRNINDIEQIMQEEAKSQIFLFEKNLGYIGSIATIAPMFGFLGTIFGVIKIFYNISLTDNISIGIIAGGLYQKMVSSAAGLTVGIIAYAGFYYLNTRIDFLVNLMERELSRVIIALKDSK